MVPAPSLGGSWLKIYFEKKYKKMREKSFFLQKFSEKIAQNKLKHSRLLPSERPLHCALNGATPQPGGILVEDIF